MVCSIIKSFLFLQLFFVDYKIINEREFVEFMENVIRGGDFIIIIVEDIEKEFLDILVVRKFRGKWNVVLVKVFGFGEFKSQYFDDIVIIIGGNNYQELLLYCLKKKNLFVCVVIVIREEDGFILDKVGKEVLGNVFKVVFIKEMMIIVGDGSIQEVVNKCVVQIKNFIEVCVR